MSIENLLAWNKLTGKYYGSEDQSIFFYSYSKMQRPKTVLELGTGLGHTALWIAQAMKENGSGHVWTVDNGARWPELLKFLEESKSRTDDMLRSFPIFQEVFDTHVSARSSPQDGEYLSACLLRYTPAVMSLHRIGGRDAKRSRRRVR